MTTASMGQFWLVTLALVAARDIFYNLLIRLQQFEFWKKLMVKWQAQRLYNPVFFAFAVEHALANTAFLIGGIVCYLLSEGVITQNSGNDFFFNNLRAFVFQTFLWDIVCWVRDHESFSSGFHKFYYAHHTMTLLLSIGWTLAGVFEQLPGRLGFFTLTFLASSMTSDLGFFVRMFCDRNSKISSQIDIFMAYSPRIWRWILITWSCIELGSGKLDLNSATTTVLGSGVFMEAMMVYLHVQRFRDTRNAQRKDESNASMHTGLNLSGSELSVDIESGDEASEDISA